MNRFIPVAAAVALLAAMPASAAPMDVDAGIARLCGPNRQCAAGQRRAFAEFRRRARIGDAVSPRVAKLIMFDCFLASGHAARIIASPDSTTPIDWRAMLACWDRGAR